MKLGNVGTVVTSLFDRIVGSYGTSFDPKTGVALIQVPDMGPKSLDVGSDQIEGFAAALADFNPDEDLGLVATVSKTLERVTVKDVPSIRFRTSLEKGSRAVTVPEKDWADFVKFWAVASEGMPDLVERYEDAIEAAGE